jgi:hypothetical protein
MRELLRREVARLAEASGRNMSDELNRIIEGGLRAEDMEGRFAELKGLIEGLAPERPPLRLDDLRASLRQMQACILDADDESVMVAIRVRRQTIDANRHLLAALLEAGAERPVRAAIRDRVEEPADVLEHSSAQDDDHGAD